MKIDVNVLDIQHDSKEGRFYFPVKDHQDAEVVYDLHTAGEPNVLEITSTFVPPTLRDNGIAEELTFETMSFARTNGYKIKPTCSYAEKYINIRPEFKKLQSN